MATSPESYDPDVPPAPAEWLALDEAMRLALVLDYHSHSATRLQNARLHSAIHVVVENQAALGDPPRVLETLERLQREGLSRHDAIHAIGGAVSQLLIDLSGATVVDRDVVIRRYSERLAEITAREFLDADD